MVMYMLLFRSFENWIWLQRPKRFAIE